MDFKKEFIKEIHNLNPDGLELGLVGILTKQSKVYTLSYDSKILSGIFEIFCEPIVTKIASTYNLLVKKSSQTVYPDFTLCRNDSDNAKIAVEVKSTYRKYNKNGSLKKFGFTLGSYKSYLRDPKGKKNILYPYKDYSEHWIIGFIYTRNPECSITEIRDIIEASHLQSPFENIKFFVQQKFKIAGMKPGSGNTTNIGSIKSNKLKDFQEGKLGFPSKIAFEEYWRKF